MQINKIRNEKGDITTTQRKFRESLDLTTKRWHMPLIPALGRQRQVDLCEIEASLVYKS